MYKLYTLTSSRGADGEDEKRGHLAVRGRVKRSAKRYIRNNAEQQGRRGGVLRKRDAADAQRKLYCYHWAGNGGTTSVGESAFGSRCDNLPATAAPGGGNGGTGDGQSKYPFGDTAQFQVPLCGRRRRRAGEQRPKLLDDV